MPKVEPNESRDHYMGRCVPICMGEGLTNEQAVGKCEGMYDSAHKKEHVMRVVKEGKGIKVIPASQARKDPEGRKAQRAVYLAQGYDGVRYENEEGVEVFNEANKFSGTGIDVDDMNKLVKDIEPTIIQLIDKIAKSKIFDNSSDIKDDTRDMGNVLGRAMMAAIIKRVPSQVHHYFISGIKDQI